LPKLRGINGNHSLVHIRHGNGGGHNEPCPRDPRPKQQEATAPARPWTEDRLNPDVTTTITIKTACTTCGRLLGDTTITELDRAVAGLPMVDTSAECGRHEQEIGRG
jgi:hypothetical protein